MDVGGPRLSWQFADVGEARGKRQTAYRIPAASSAALLARNKGELWDTGKVASDATLQLPYTGRALHSAQQVFWKARAWDETRTAGAWSPVATWTMGMLSSGDWKARWIAAPAVPPTQTVLLRRGFSVRAKLRRAVVFVCGLGQYELSVNGHRVGDALLTPGWSLYPKTCLYDTYDGRPCCTPVPTPPD